MAERRMFAKAVIDSDAFLELPVKSQLLYFHLAMRADDDGFVNKCKSILRMIKATEKDFRILVDGGFLIPFDSTVVIRHWKVHNYIRKDAYKETTYKAEKAALVVDDNCVYGLSQDCDDAVTELLTQVREEQDRQEKERERVRGERFGQTARRFVPPALGEVVCYCAERGNLIDARRFVDYYESNGWMVGRNKMKDWRAAVRSWERKEQPEKSCNPFLEMAVEG